TVYGGLALAEPVKLGAPFGVQIGARSEDHDAGAWRQGANRRDQSEGLEGLPHADLIGQHHARSCLEHRQRAKNRVLLALDVVAGHAISVRARAEWEKGPEPSAVADHERSSRGR